MPAGRGDVGHHPRGVTFIPVPGVPPGEVVLAWDAHQPPRHISDLLTAARMQR